MNKKWLWGGLAGVLVVGLAGGFLLLRQPAGAGAAQPAVGKNRKAEPPLEFVAREVVQPTLARMPAVVEFSGPLVAPQTALLRARAGGTLLALAAAEGSRVQAGQVLGRIELADLASRVDERSANLESARTAVVQAERTHASNERLANAQFISSIALDNSRSALDTARAGLNAAQAALATTRVGLRDATLVAPISGIVAKRHALPGEKVSVEQPLLTIVDLARLELAGAIGTHEVGRIAAGMPVTVQVEGVTGPVAGRIARIAPAAEPGTRSIGVTIELPNACRSAGPPQAAAAPSRGAGNDAAAACSEQLRGGQYALARAVLSDDSDRLTLPAAAVGSTSGQDHVWLIENGALARRAVTLGRRDAREGRVEVLAGVTPASQVLAARFDNLREGARALVVPTKTAPVASAAASTPVVR